LNIENPNYYLSPQLPSSIIKLYINKKLINYI
jgi:hypothetical protein